MKNGIIRVSNIIAHLNKIVNPLLAYEWDNVGFQLGDGDAEVKKILLTLDVTENAINKAIKKNVDLIISHHPFIFKPIKKITNPIYLKLIKNNISVFCVHTNLDVIKKGVNDALAKKLCLQNTKIILNETGLTTEITKYFQKDDENIGLGLIGNLENPQKLDEFAKFVKIKLGSPFIKLWLANKSESILIKKVAICGGNGSNLIPKIVGNADVFVSADFTYHTILNSRIPLIDAGHFYTENPVLENLKIMLSKFDVEIIELKSEEHEIRNWIVM
jgi:GTP cyclohydrolase I